MNKSKLFMRARRDVDLLVLTMTILPGWCGAATSAISGFSELPGAPSALTDRSGLGGVDGEIGDLLDGFTFTTAAAGTYNSNIDQKAPPPGKTERNDFILGLGGGVKYLSKSSGWTFGGNYKGNYNQYFDNTSFSAYNQSGGAVVNYEGGRISASLRGSVSYYEGTNRDYDSSFVKMVNYSTGLTGRYRMSSKTTIAGEISQQYISTLDDDFGDTEAFNIGASALWKYSSLTEFGPGVRYTYRSGSSQTGRSTIGPTLSLNYQLSSKVDLTSRAGVEFTSYDEGGDSDPFFATSIAVKYKASKLWDMNILLQRDADADPLVPGAFSEKTLLGVGVSRKLRRATLGLGVSYTTNEREFPDNTSAAAGDKRDYFTIKSDLEMLIFSNTTMASVFLQYSDQSSDLNKSWDAIQTGISLSRSF